MAQRRAWVGWVIGVWLVLGLVACNAATQSEDGTPESVEPQGWRCPEGEHTLTLWHGWEGEYFEAINAIFTEYQATCPNITLQLIVQENLGDAVAETATGVEEPDIIAWVNDQIGRNAEAGIIVPLDAYVDRPTFEADFNGTAVAAVTYREGIWAFPESLEVISMIYNRDLISLRELPGNTDELLANAAAWEKSEYYLVYPARNDAYFSAPWWQGAGVTIINEEGQTNFAQQGKDAAEFLVALREFMPEEIDYDTASQLFLQGEAAIIINGPWYIAELEKAGIDYGIATLPVFSSTRLPASPFVGVKVLMLTKAAESRGTADAAVNVMQYYTRAEAQSKLVQANKLIPAHRRVASSINLEALPAIAAFIDQASVGQPLPNTPFMSAMWDPIADGLECLWEGAEPTQGCLDLIQSQAEENIAAMKEEMK